jgi:glucose/arabinose dehydrogenase
MRRRVSIAFVAFVAVVAGCTQGAGERATTTIPAGPVPSTSDPTPTSPDTAVSSTIARTSSSLPEQTTTTRAELMGLGYEPLELGLTFPIVMTARPGSDESWIATKDGKVWKISEDGLSAAPVLDLSAQVRNQGEQGFLGMELSRQDQDTVYVHYSASDGDTVVSEVRLASTGFEERVLLRLDQPAPNHNGGMLQFGPDGRLYVGLGDGGGAGDRFGNAQDTDTLLGGIVGIDTTTGEAALWSHGLRNPWRFWFDGDSLYVGDVGQGRYEEIDVVAFDPAGFDFGWPITEASHCYLGGGCEVAGMTLPVIEVEHGDAGTCSITGGVVYRGDAIPELAGHYLYSDYCGGWLRSFRWDGSEAVDLGDWTADTGVPGSVVSFGIDGSGEVYILTPQDVFRLVARR